MVGWPGEARRQWPRAAKALSPEKTGYAWSGVCGHVTATLKPCGAQGPAGDKTAGEDQEPLLEGLACPTERKYKRNLLRKIY